MSSSWVEVIYIISTANEFVMPLVKIYDHDYTPSDGKHDCKMWCCCAWHFLQLVCGVLTKYSVLLLKKINHTTTMCQGQEQAHMSRQTEAKLKAKIRAKKMRDGPEPSGRVSFTQDCDLSYH